MNIRKETALGLGYVHVTNDHFSGSYVLEVGRKSGLVCLEVWTNRTSVRYVDVTHLCDQMPQDVQEAILSLFVDQQLQNSLVVC